MASDHERSGGLIGGGNGTLPVDVVELTIRFDPKSGGIQVGGPIDNSMLCYALLEMARDIIYRQRLPGEIERLAQKAAQQPGLVRADGPLPPFRKP